MHPHPSFSITIKTVDHYLQVPDAPDALRLLKEGGFDHIHFSYRWTSVAPCTMQELEQMKANLDLEQVRVLDVHGSHPRYKGRNLDLSEESEEGRQLAFDRFRERLQIAHFFGADAVVYHVPTCNMEDPKILYRYVEGLKHFEEEARNLGVSIAIENHFKSENDKMTLSRCFEIFDPAYVGLTFDTGHAALSGNQDWILAHCMSRLKVLHLNDNDGKSDLHHPPYWEHGIVDWEAVTRGIAQSPYQKPMQLELKRHADIYPSLEKLIAVSAQSAHRVHQNIDTCRQVEASPDGQGKYTLPS